MAVNGNDAARIDRDPARTKLLSSHDRELIGQFQGTQLFDRQDSSDLGRSFKARLGGGFALTFGYNLIVGIMRLDGDTQHQQP